MSDIKPTVTKKLKIHHNNNDNVNSNKTIDDMRSLSVFCVEKGGMNNVDMTNVNKVVYESSQNSAHFKHSIALAEKTTKRIELMKHKLNELKVQWKSFPLTYNKAIIDTQHKITELLSTSQYNRYWIHIDLDMFYAACELLERPDLHDKPVAVGGIGMITTANYVARKYGVRAAMYVVK